MNEELTGRALDATVAERVMGWQRITWISDEDGDDPYGFAPDVYPGYVETENRGKDCIVPHYSSDIAAAWQVVQRTQQLGWWARLTLPCNQAGTKYSCGFTPRGLTGWNGRPDYEAIAETMPVAICQAAIAALEARHDR